MKGSTVRILQVQLTNFKNVKHGAIEFLNKTAVEQTGELQNVDLLGIYGQNGSGKTAFIQSLQVLKSILNGGAVSQRYTHLFSEKEATLLKFEFFVRQKEKKYIIEYSCQFQLNEEKEVVLEAELYTYREYRNSSWGDSIPLFCIDPLSEVGFTPVETYEEFIRSNPEGMIDFIVTRKMAHLNRTSLLFSKEFRKLVNPNNTQIIQYDIIRSLYNFARTNLYIVDVEQLGLIHGNDYLRLKFRLEDKNALQGGEVKLNLFEASLVPVPYYDTVSELVKQINLVIQAMIPGLSMDIRHLGVELSKESIEMARIQLVACRYGKTFPLKQESEGIRRILSILSMVIAVYNDETVCLAIDELDSGIFEFLLGELLSVLNMGTKGQIIFTSHNLRALEKLQKENIVVSTTNEQNRYIKFSNVCESNNLRDFYLRAILLGGQTEEIYERTDQYEIEYALRKAGEYTHGK